MAFATLDLRLPSQPHGITDHRLHGTKLYCLVTEAHVCEQLAGGCYLTAERPGLELATILSRKSNALNGDAENARHEIAGHENAAPECKGGKCET